MSNTYDEFNGKVVLITGSSAGIGAAAALEFAKCGAHVVITGRKAQTVKETAEECRKVSPKGLKALEVVVDISKLDDCKRLVDTTIKTFGKLDVLVNNAAYGDITKIADPQLIDKYEMVMNTNLRSVIYLTQLSVEHLEKTKGNIINVSAIAGIRPSAMGFLYGMSKSALDMFSKCMALELGPKGIRVNIVNPAAVRTDFGMSLGIMTREQFDGLMHVLAKGYPLGRVGEAIDIANVILFLASDKCSFVTGINFVSDGGSLYAPQGNAVDLNAIGKK